MKKGFRNSTPKEKKGKYECKTCKASSEKEGKCCGAPMAKMAVAGPEKKAEGILK